MTDDEFKLAVVKEQLESVQAQHDELFKVWLGLESKSQGCIALAGIYLAASLAFVPMNDATLSTLSGLLLLACVLTLTASIAFSLVVLWIRRIPSPPIGSRIEDMTYDIVDSDQILDLETRINYYRERCDLWSDLLNATAEVNYLKARFVVGSQTLLCVAIGCGSLLLLIHAWS